MATIRQDSYGIGWDWTRLARRHEPGIGHQHGVHKCISNVADPNPRRPALAITSPAPSVSTRRSAAAATSVVQRSHSSPAPARRGTRIHWGRLFLSSPASGRVQREGGPIEEIRPGDIVWFEPGEKHWHGAAPDCAMTHTAIAEMQDGKAVEWLEKVSDADYAP
jgi:hypothetical protein